MTISKLNVEMDHISRLSDLPSADDISAAELKARFDEGNRQIKQYLNNVLTEEVDAELAQLKEQLRLLSLPRDICWQLKQGTALLRVGGWLKEAETGLFAQSVTDAEIATDMDVDVLIDAADMANAALGGGRVDAYAGGFTVRVLLQPLHDLNISYRVLARG